MADTLRLGRSAERCGGSSPFQGTNSSREVTKQGRGGISRSWRLLTSFLKVVMDGGGLATLWAGVTLEYDEPHCCFI